LSASLKKVHNLRTSLVASTVRGAVMARPKAEINPQHVYKLARLGATQAEMADFFECDHSTISKRFSQEIAKGKAELILKLRRLQLRAAENGNLTMLIWLGKNMLGQCDKPKDEQTEEKINVIID
jgi:hypothetical protein